MKSSCNVDWWGHMPPPHISYEKDYSKEVVFSGKEHDKEVHILETLLN